MREIDTCDENAQGVFTKTVFRANIQTVPETLPRPIPTTVPIYSRLCFSVDAKYME